MTETYAGAEVRKSGARTAQNMLVMLATQLLSWGLAFAVSLYLPRYLGAAYMGKLGFATSIVAIIGTFAPLGTTVFLTKEIARDRDKTQGLVLNAIAVRLSLALTLSCLAALITSLTGVPDLTRTLIMIGCASLMVMTVNEALAAALQGQENFVRHSLVTLTEKFFLSGATLALIVLHAPLTAIASVAVVAAFLALVVNLTGYRLLVPRLPHDSRSVKRPPVTLSSMHTLVVAALPYMGWSAFQALYGQTDPIVLNIFTNETTVGWYSAAFRLVGSTLFFPSAVAVVLSPRLSKAYVHGTGEFAQITRRMLSLVTFLAIPIALIFLCVPELMIQLLGYPASFDGIIPVLRFAGVGVVLWFVAVAVGTAVVASDGQMQMLRASILAMVVGIPLCVVSVMIAHKLGNGAAGAMASDALLEALLVFCYLRALPPGTLGRGNLFEFLRFLLAGVPTALVLAIGSRYVGLWSLAAAALVYLGACIAVRALNDDHLTLAKSFARRPQ